MKAGTLRDYIGKRVEIVPNGCLSHKVYRGIVVYSKKWKVVVVRAENALGALFIEGDIDTIKSL